MIMEHNRQVRVLWLVWGYPHKNDPYNGTFLKVQAEALNRLGVHIDICAPTPWVPPLFEYMKPKWLRYKRLPRHEFVNGIDIYRPRYITTPKQLLWGWPHIEIFRAASQYGYLKSEIIHAHFAIPLGAAALFLANKWNVRTILTLHGGDVNILPHSNSRNKQLFHRVIVNTDMVIAVSNPLSKETEVLTGVRPTVLPIGVNLDAYNRLPPKNVARNQLGLPLESFIITYIGSISKAKGITELVDALKALNNENVRCLLVGEGDLFNEIDSLPCAIAVGAKPHNTIPLYLAASDLFVLPSHSEGMPTVLIEAGAASVPIIATRVGGIPELLDEDRGILIEPYSSKELLSAIIYAIANNEVLKRRSAILYKYITNNYSVDINANRLLGIYRSVLCE